MSTKWFINLLARKENPNRVFMQVFSPIHNCWRNGLQLGQVSLLLKSARKVISIAASIVIWILSPPVRALRVSESRIAASRWCGATRVSHAILLLLSGEALVVLNWPYLFSRNGRNFISGRYNSFLFIITLYLSFK